MPTLHKGGVGSFVGGSMRLPVMLGVMLVALCGGASAVLALPGERATRIPQVGIHQVWANWCSSAKGIESSTGVVALKVRCMADDSREELWRIRKPLSKTDSTTVYWVTSVGRGPSQVDYRRIGQGYKVRIIGKTR